MLLERIITLRDPENIGPMSIIITGAPNFFHNNTEIFHEHTFAMNLDPKEEEDIATPSFDKER